MCYFKSIFELEQIPWLTKTTSMCYFKFIKILEQNFRQIFFSNLAIYTP